MKRAVLKHADIVGELNLGSLGVEFATLPAGRLRRGWGVALPGIDMSDPQDCPGALRVVSGWRCPIQTAVGGHLVGNVDDILSLDKRERILLSVLLVGFLGYEGPASLASPAVLSGG